MLGKRANTSVLFIDCCPQKCNIDWMPAIEHDNETAEMTEKDSLCKQRGEGERERELANTKNY